MKRIHVPNPFESQMVLKSRSEWPEASVVAYPVRSQDLGDDPRLLVQRSMPDVAGPNHEHIAYFPGHPVISLFSGCGGMDLGLEQAGFVTVVQVEYDEACCQTLMVNRPHYFRHAALIQADICGLPTSRILAEAGLHIGEATIVCGGPPCQGYSFSGRRDPKDPRNNLVFEFLRVVREAQPKFFIMENVPGMVAKQMFPIFERFIRTAYEGYYELVYGLLNAVEYGVPQDRTRLFVIGTRRDLFENEGKIAGMPSPTHFGHETLRESQYLRTRLDGLYRDEFEDRLHDLETVFGIRHFQDRPVLKPPKPTTSHDAHSGRSETYIRFWRRLQKSEPDRLVVTKS